MSTKLRFNRFKKVHSVHLIAEQDGDATTLGDHDHALNPYVRPQEVQIFELLCSV